MPSLRRTKVTVKIGSWHELPPNVGCGNTFDFVYWVRSKLISPTDSSHLWAGAGILVVQRSRYYSNTETLRVVHRKMTESVGLG
jgi:hypothetical protein